MKAVGETLYAAWLVGMGVTGLVVLGPMGLSDDGVERVLDAASLVLAGMLIALGLRRLIRLAITEAIEKAKGE